MSGASLGLHRGELGGFRLGAPRRAPAVVERAPLALTVGIRVCPDHCRGRCGKAESHTDRNGWEHVSPSPVCVLMCGEAPTPGRVA